MEFNKQCLEGEELRKQYAQKPMGRLDTFHHMYFLLLVAVVISSAYNPIYVHALFM